MTVATLKTILDAAAAGRYAIAGLVVLGWEDARAYVDAAEETGIPIILQAGPGCRRHMPVSILGKMFRTLAEGASVPIGCHIDHATTLDECVQGIENGFTSVMIDGSNLPIEENIALSARVVERARKAGVSVEGEVGIVGYNHGAASRATAPDEAARFDRESGVDALAISIGNVHLNTEQASQIDIAALRAIEAVTHLPLVLHGASGIRAADRRILAANHRVAKLNIGTELRMTFGKALREKMAKDPDAFDRIELLSATMEPMRQEAEMIITALRHPVRGPSRV